MKIPNFIKNLFKKNNDPEKSLEKALAKGFIDPEECLRLKRDRAIADYEGYCEIQKIKKKK